MSRNLSNPEIAADVFVGPLGTLINASLSQPFFFTQFLHSLNSEPLKPDNLDLERHLSEEVWNELKEYDIDIDLDETADTSLDPPVKGGELKPVSKIYLKLLEAICLALHNDRNTLKKRRQHWETITKMNSPDEIREKTALFVDQMKKIEQTINELIDELPVTYELVLDDEELNPIEQQRAILTQLQNYNASTEALLQPSSIEQIEQQLTAAEPLFTEITDDNEARNFLNDYPTRIEHHSSSINLLAHLLDLQKKLPACISITNTEEYLRRLPKTSDIIMEHGSIFQVIAVKFINFLDKLIPTKRKTLLPSYMNNHESLTSARDKLIFFLKDSRFTEGYVYELYSNFITHTARWKELKNFHPYPKIYPQLTLSGLLFGAGAAGFFKTSQSTNTEEAKSAKSACQTPH